MKVAVSASGADLNSQVDPRFGRCAYFLIVETDDMSYEALNNASMSLGGGAGIASAQAVASKGVKAVITGNCGPNAVNTLAAAGIQLYVGQSGSVQQAVENFRNNQLSATSEANVVDHFGMGGGMGGGRGGGGGMGGGRGGGGGMGGGRGGGGGMGGGRGGGGGMGGGRGRG